MSADASPLSAIAGAVDLDYVTWTQVQTSNAGVCPSVIFQKGIIHLGVLDYLLPGRRIERKRADISKPKY